MIMNYTGATGNGKTWITGDIDNDGDINTYDLTRGIINFTRASNTTAAIPEPSGLLLLVLAVSCLSRNGSCALLTVYGKHARETARGLSIWSPGQFHPLGVSGKRARKKTSHYRCQMKESEAYLCSTMKTKFGPFTPFVTDSLPQGSEAWALA